MIQSKTKVFISSLFLGLMLANFASAQLVTCSPVGNTDPTKACQISDLIFTIERIVNFLLSWAWIIAIFVILWAGWQLISSAGNQEQIAKGKETLKNGIIGFVIIMASYVIINLAVSLLVSGNNQQNSLEFFLNFIR